MVKEFNKSLSNTSTTSVESGVFDLDDSFETSTGLKMNIGDAVKHILVEANDENRLICGLNNASKFLRNTENPEHSLFFFIAPSVNGDSVTHMQEVVLQAFCFENDIYIVKLDSGKKLNSILGLKTCDDTCALVQRSAVMDIKNNDVEVDLNKFTELENILIDHCEDFWSEPIQPIIRLPEKWRKSERKLGIKLKISWKEKLKTFVDLKNEQEKELHEAVHVPLRDKKHFGNQKWKESNLKKNQWRLKFLLSKTFEKLLLEIHFMNDMK